MNKKNSKQNRSIQSIRYGADTMELTSGNLPEFIQKRAYHLFELRGRIPGHELEDWLQAEREMKTSIPI